ncbi:Uncharacterized protein APZ42_016822 [Daphnia magna]|uniref:Uncharacterized protein n=1 Tax=Daphnia magna TaxID=35525 RepID=A0A165A722_9CRUS|nr:Uncharacterized protein APZ42_016822 [Daphnia magna]
MQTVIYLICFLFWSFLLPLLSWIRFVFLSLCFFLVYIVIRTVRIQVYLRYLCDRLLLVGMFSFPSELIPRPGRKEDQADNKRKTQGSRKSFCSIQIDAHFHMDISSFLSLSTSLLCFSCINFSPCITSFFNHPVFTFTF